MTESAQSCGHPNHGNAEHDCAPFRAQPSPFSGPWEHEVNPDILRADARWDDSRAAHLAEQALDLRERSGRFTATAQAKRRKASELEDEERRGD